MIPEFSEVKWSPSVSSKMTMCHGFIICPGLKVRQEEENLQGLLLNSPIPTTQQFKNKKKLCFWNSRGRHSFIDWFPPSCYVRFPVYFSRQRLEHVTIDRYPPAPTFPPKFRTKMIVTSRVICRGEDREAAWHGLTKMAATPLILVRFTQLKQFWKLETKPQRIIMLLIFFIWGKG